VTVTAQACNGNNNNKNANNNQNMKNWTITLQNIINCKQHMSITKKQGKWQQQQQREKVEKLTINQWCELLASQVWPSRV